MKSSLEQTENSLSTTSEFKKLQSKENNHLFNHIDKLAVDHDVTVTNTMIKVTYKKALKDQNLTDSNIGLPKEGKKTKPANSKDFFLKKSSKPLFHSTPKPSLVQTEKKKKYLNGLNLIAKQNNQESTKNRASHKLQKPSDNTVKNVLDSNKKFLKDDGLIKLNSSISQKGKVDKKKTKESDKKLAKLKNVEKKKSVVEKKEEEIGGIKRKASNTELNMLVKTKKMKIGESDEKELNEIGDAEEGNKSGRKRSIMLVDPELPPGWSRFIRTKDEGSGNDQPVVYIVNPQGKKFRYKWKLRKYLKKTNSTLDADRFFFGLYQRPKQPPYISEKLEDDSESSKEDEDKGEKQDGLSDEGKSSDGKELLLFDPDLPLGWKRIIHSNAINGKKQVHIISPDGKIFRRRYLLNEYLIKHQFSHNLDRFYFGLYPKKEGNSENLGKEMEDKTLNSIKLIKPSNSSKTSGSAMILGKTKITNNDINLNHGGSIPSSAMFEDPNLPEGWKRFIKIRSCGESAGKMEVVIISPDGRRHRSKKHLEHYLLQKQLKHKIEDFDFSVFGKASNRRRPANPPNTPKPPKPSNPPNPPNSPDPESSYFSFLSMKKKFTDQPVPELDISSLKEEVITPEGHMINTVNGLMMCSGMSSARNERRQRVPRAVHEKLLKSYLNSESDFSCDVGCEIPKFWIERLVKCRADFRELESDALSAIAKTTEEFIKRLSLYALANSQDSKPGLRYEHLAEVINRTEFLSFLKELIPKKITFREYIKINRPKQFLSFT